MLTSRRSRGSRQRFESPCYQSCDFVRRTAISSYEERKSKFDLSLAFVEVVVEELRKIGLKPEIVVF